MFYATIAFLIGALTSVICGYIGMYVAVQANVRTTKEAACNGINAAFLVAYRGGEVMGFVLVGVALLVLSILIVTYEAIYIGNSKSMEKHQFVFDMLAGYGLGGSTIALFARVGGGIYTKAADVGSDLVGKVEQALNEDSPYNPGVIADNVGDNVGDIAGMGADLFGSLAEATCAALVVSGTSEVLISTPGAIWFPLSITAGGIVVSIITTLIAPCIKVDEKTVERNLKI